MAARKRVTRTTSTGSKMMRGKGKAAMKAGKTKASGSKKMPRKGGMKSIPRKPGSGYSK